MSKLERLIDWVMRAGADGGWKLAAVVAAFLAVVVLGLAWMGVNLLEDAHDDVLRPVVAEAPLGIGPSLVHEACPGGYSLSEFGRSDVAGRRCVDAETGIVVTLDVESDVCNTVQDTRAGGATGDGVLTCEELVERGQWPASRLAPEVP